MHFLSFESTAHTQTAFVGLNLHCLPFCHAAKIRLVRSNMTVCVCAEICNTADSASEHPSFHDRLRQRISIGLCVTLCRCLFSPAEGNLSIWFHMSVQKWDCLWWLKMINIYSTYYEKLLNDALKWVMFWFISKCIHSKTHTFTFAARMTLAENVEAPAEITA